MGKNNRQQLTLFLSKKDSPEIENIRRKFNPTQQGLIDSHVTLCREDEILSFDKVLGNLENLDSEKITIHFAPPIRFNDNKGVLIPAAGNNEQFHLLRKKILTAARILVRHYEPHITLMHPRNSSCTDDIFKEIQSVNLPATLQFDIISLIEQVNGGKWKILNQFNLRSE